MEMSILMTIALLYFSVIYAVRWCLEFGRIIDLAIKFGNETIK